MNTKTKKKVAPLRKVTGTAYHHSTNVHYLECGHDIVVGTRNTKADRASRVVKAHRCGKCRRGQPTRAEIESRNEQDRKTQDDAQRAAENDADERERKIRRAREMATSLRHRCEVNPPEGGTVSIDLGHAEALEFVSLVLELLP